MLNALLGQKIAIVTPKPQTTRDRIVGVMPVPGGQVVFLDTPGIHDGQAALNRHMTDVALSTLAEVDVIVALFDASHARDGVISGPDQRVIDALKSSRKPAIAVLSKIDKVRKPALLPTLAALDATGAFVALIPVSATTGDGLDRLVAEIVPRLPEGPALYPEDDLTDRPMRFLCAELLREQIMLALTDELPYSAAVEVAAFTERADKPLVEIEATIHVERDSQKGILIGKRGEMLRQITSAARTAMEELVGKQVFLRTFIRVEPNWTKDPAALEKLGYRATEKRRRT